MLNIYQFSEPEILSFFLVLVRSTSFVVSWPVFGVTLVPSPLKILFGLTLALLLFPVVDLTQVQTDLISAQITWLTIKEVFIGLSIGFLGRLFFFAVQIAGEIISSSMGLSSAQMFNPALGERASALQQFEVAIATLFFLAIKGHHLFLSGLADSFRMIPISNTGIHLLAFKNIGVVVQEIMEIGLKICAPVLIAILFMNIAMAIVGRTVPQINVLITSLPVNILVGYLVLIISIPFLIWQMHDLLELSAVRLFQILKAY